MEEAPNDFAGINVAAGSTATLNATLWYANTTDWSGNVIRANDHNGNPAFAPDGYHLTDTSAAIDQGVDAGVTDDMWDREAAGVTLRRLGR